MKMTLLLLLLSLSTVQYVWAKNPIHISTFQTDDVLTEIAKEVMTIAYNKLGEKVIYEYLPAERGIISANDGVVFGELYRIEGLENRYSNLIRIPVPVCYGTLYAFSLKGRNVSIKKWDDLKPYSIAYRLGLKAVEKKTQGYLKYPVADLVQAVQMLKSKRVDFIVDTQSSVDLSQKKLGITGIKKHDPPLESMPLFHYINRSNKNYYDSLKRVLNQMTKTGEINAIAKRVLAHKKASPHWGR